MECRINLKKKQNGQGKPKFRMQTVTTADGRNKKGKSLGGCGIQLCTPD